MRRSVPEIFFATCIALVFGLSVRAAEPAPDTLVFKKTDKEQIAKVLDYEYMPTGMALIMRLNTGRVFALGCSWGEQTSKKLNADKVVLSLGFLSTMNEPVWRSFKESELLDMAELLHAFELTLTTDPQRGETNRHLKRLVDGFMTGEYANKDDEKSAGALTKELLPAYLAMVYARILHDKAPSKEDVPDKGAAK